MKYFKDKFKNNSTTVDTKEEELNQTNSTTTVDNNIDTKEEELNQTVTFLSRNFLTPVEITDILAAKINITKAKTVPTVLFNNVDYFIVESELVGELLVTFEGLTILEQLLNQ